jgi:hypothetical protein
MKTTTKILHATIALLAAWSCAEGGTVYRIVGPDGKVTFSDTPPVEAPAGAYDVVGRNGTAQPNARTAQDSAPVAAEETAPSERSAPRPAAATSPVLEAAVVGVLGIEDIVVRTQGLCADASPNAAAGHAAVAAEWRDRNGDVVARARQALEHDVDAAARERIEGRVRTQNDAMFEAVAAASDAARASWCDESLAATAAGKMDVHRNGKLTAPLQ